MSRILLINYSDTNSELEEVKTLLSFEGNVEIVTGNKLYVEAKLKECPADMEFVLIEKTVRPVKEIVRTSVTPTGMIRVAYSDGTSEKFDNANDPETKAKHDEMFTTEAKWAPGDEGEPDPDSERPWIEAPEIESWKEDEDYQNPDDLLDDAQKAELQKRNDEQADIDTVERIRRDHADYEGEKYEDNT